MASLDPLVLLPLTCPPHSNQSDLPKTEGNVIPPGYDLQWLLTVFRRSLLHNRAWAVLQPHFLHFHQFEWPWASYLISHCLHFSSISEIITGLLQCSTNITELLLADTLTCLSELYNRATQNAFHFFRGHALSFQCLLITLYQDHPFLSPPQPYPLLTFNLVTPSCPSGLSSEVWCARKSSTPCRMGWVPPFCTPFVPSTIST